MSAPQQETAPEPSSPEVDDNELVDDNGVDLTQIHMMLAMTPTERVRYIQSLAQSVVRLRRGIRRIS